jgi:hypothetical protein
MRQGACTSDAATTNVKKLGCNTGLSCVKQRPLLTARPSIMCGILVTSTWCRTRFTTQSKVGQERVSGLQHKGEGGGVGKISDANMG